MHINVTVTISQPISKKTFDLIACSYAFVSRCFYPIWTCFCFHLFLSFSSSNLYLYPFSFWYWYWIFLPKSCPHPKPYSQMILFRSRVQHKSDPHLIRSNLSNLDCNDYIIEPQPCWISINANMGSIRCMKVMGCRLDKKARNVQKQCQEWAMHHYAFSRCILHMQYSKQRVCGTSKSS